MPRKRHRAWSNSEAIGLLDRGFLRKKAREKCVIKTATRKKTKSGKVSYSGTKWLKGTQCWPQLFGFACVFLHEGWFGQAIQVILIVLICRSYPIAFGLRVQRILPKLLKKKSTAPRLPTEPAEGWNAPAMFQRLDFEDSWEEAKLMESCIYLRGSVHLKVPARWKKAFPTHV